MYTYNHTNIIYSHKQSISLLEKSKWNPSLMNKETYSLLKVWIDELIYLGKVSVIDRPLQAKISERNEKGQGLKKIWKVE